MTALPATDTAAIRHIIRECRAAGLTLSHVDDGGDWDEDVPVSTEPEALAAITAVGEARLYFTRPDGKQLGIFFVLGNAPDEVACDWHDVEPLRSAMEAVLADWQRD